jgi:hypothetical protein
LNGVGCAIEHAQIRYGGRNSPCIDVSQSDTLLRAVQVGFALSDGFELDTMTQDAIDLVAHDCGHDGIFLRSGAFDVLHATVADNGGAGLRRWFQSGQVRNSVSWNNAEGNYVGLPVADVHFSDGGFPGVNGNIDQDPQFERTTDFDLRLGASSPCLDVADFSTAATVASDADEASRVSDHELLGVMAADMGAFERAAFTVSSTGALRPGQAPAFAVEGPPAFAVVIVGFLDFEVLLAPYGVDLAGVVGSFTLGLGLTEQPFVLAIPDDASLLGLELGVQGLGLVFVDGAWLGGFTNLYRGRIY